VVSEAERRDLTEVAEFLACKELLNEMVDEEMRVVRTGIEERVKTGRTESYTEAPTPLADTTPGKSAFAGKTVCFTGESRCSKQGIPLTRSMCEALASNAGLTVARSVTKALDIVVVADPDTMSGKAEKARRYGTRIMAEPVFWRLLGIAVD
jgi:DNA polymerase-3 subunit epsilon